MTHKVERLIDICTFKPLDLAEALPFETRPAIHCRINIHTNSNMLLLTFRSAVLTGYKIYS